MIKYNLKCVCGSVFESWFASSNSYDSLKRRKLVKCIHCDSDLVEKSIMAPNLKSKSNKFTIKNNQEKKIRKQLLDLKKFVEKNCKNVGEDFPSEARRIHYDKKNSKGIYGKASPEETAELIEEGIEVASIPWPEKSEN